MPLLIAFPILIGLMMLQSGVISNVPLLHGTPDLLLIAVVGWAVQKKVETAWHWAVISGILFELMSALPPGTALAGYLAAAGMTLLLRRHVWQVPLLAMIVSIFLGTFITQGLAMVALRISGSPIPLLQALETVVLPSLMLNLLISIPAYGFFNDLASWLHHEEIEE